MKNELRFLTTLLLIFFTLYAHAQWTTQATTQTRFHLGAGATSDQLFFAGGTRNGMLQPSDLVEIYNTIDDTWETTQMSTPRSFPTVVVHGNKVFIAGGNNIATGENYNIIDVYDTTTDTWTQETLSTPRTELEAVAIGNKIIFAGGGYIDAFIQSFTTSDVVDIYDTVTETWSTATLSEPRIFLAATTVGNKAFFAGGCVNNGTVSNHVDIYDAETNTWTVDSLSDARMFLAAVGIGDKAIFAGGNDATGTNYSTVDIYDTSTGTWSTDELSIARMGLQGIEFCGKAYFIAGGDINWTTKFLTNSYKIIDIYDPNTNMWELDELPIRRNLFAAAANETDLMVLGGFDAPAASIENSADQLFCITNSTAEHKVKDESWRIFPIPNQGQKINIEFPDHSLHPTNINIYNANNRLLKTFPVSRDTEEIEIDNHDLAAGIYYVQLTTSSGSIGLKRLVIMKL